jgi:hypothetical protein
MHSPLGPNAGEAVGDSVSPPRSTKSSDLVRAIEVGQEPASQIPQSNSSPTSGSVLDDSEQQPLMSCPVANEHEAPPSRGRAQERGAYNHYAGLGKRAAQSNPRAAASRDSQHRRQQQQQREAAAEQETKTQVPEHASSSAASFRIPNDLPPRPALERRSRRPDWMTDFGRWFANVTRPRENRLSNPLGFLPKVLSKDKGETIPTTNDDLATARRKRKDAAGQDTRSRTSENTEYTVSEYTVDPTTRNTTTLTNALVIPRSDNTNAFNQPTQAELYQSILAENARSASPPPPYNITAPRADESVPENDSETTIVAQENEDNATTPAPLRVQELMGRRIRIRRRLRDFGNGFTAATPGMDMSYRAWRRSRGDRRT